MQYLVSRDRTVQPEKSVTPRAEVNVRSDAHDMSSRHMYEVNFWQETIPIISNKALISQFAQNQRPI